jgi:hypothetical protein
MVESAVPDDMNGIAIAVKCNWCTHQRPNFRVHRLESGQVICDYCLEWHFHALDMLGGEVPRGCQGCETSMEVLMHLAGGESARLYVVAKDGIYQMLCAQCVRPYLPKRPDLYKGTDFGRNVLKL